MSGDAGQKGDQFGPVEPREVEPVDAREALSLCQPGRERMASVELIGAEGPDDEQPLVTPVAREIREQVARGPVRPMQVLDDEEDRSCRSEASEQPQDALEDADLHPIRGAR